MLVRKSSECSGCLQNGIDVRGFILEWLLDPPIEVASWQSKEVVFRVSTGLVWCMRHNFHNFFKIVQMESAHLVQQATSVFISIKRHPTHVIPWYWISESERIRHLKKFGSDVPFMYYPGMTMLRCMHCEAGLRITLRLAGLIPVTVKV